MDAMIEDDTNYTNPQSNFDVKARNNYKTASGQSAQKRRMSIVDPMLKSRDTSELGRLKAAEAYDQG